MKELSFDEIDEMDNRERTEHANELAKEIQEHREEVDSLTNQYLYIKSVIYQEIYDKIRDDRVEIGDNIYSIREDTRRFIVEEKQNSRKRDLDIQSLEKSMVKLEEKVNGEEEE